MSNSIRQNWEDTWGFLADERIADNARRARQFGEVWSNMSFDRISQRAFALEGTEKEIWDRLWFANAQSMPEKQLVFQMGLWTHAEPLARKMLFANEILTAQMFAPGARRNVAAQLGISLNLLDKVERALLVKLLYSHSDTK